MNHTPKYVSREEADQLARSTKKAKMEAGVSSSEDETVVMETYLLENNAATEVSKEATTIGMKMERGVVSYRDLCLGKDNMCSEDEGSSDSEESDEDDSHDRSYVAEEEDEDDTSGEEASLDEENDAPIGDARCPVVKVSREERKNACLPRKNSVIVKLLGKKGWIEILNSQAAKNVEPNGRNEGH
ncbi:hypothetical protein SESBI_07185 [Sesbania bispinosa]|nr:hypothetical protein SESBI_07185 [Sesbania bispinosa]